MNQIVNGQIKFHRLWLRFTRGCGHVFQCEQIKWGNFKLKETVHCKKPNCQNGDFLSKLPLTQTSFFVYSRHLIDFQATVVVSGVNLQEWAFINQLAWFESVDEHANITNAFAAFLLCARMKPTSINWRQKDNLITNALGSTINLYS